MGNQRKTSEIVKFTELFWAARKEHVKSGKKASANERMHKRALTFAIEHDMKWGELLLNVSLSSNRGQSEDALKTLVAKWNEIPTSQQGLGYFIRGSVLLELNRTDEGIKAYRKALADPKFDMSGTVWNNLGNAYSEKGEYDEGIKAYRKALADPKHDTPGDVWSNLGLAYSDKGEYDEGIKACRKALADPKYGTPGNAWNNLGIAYSGRGEYDEAIKAYRKALADPKFDTPGWAWNNIGIAYSEKGEYDEAIKAYRKALADPKYDTPGKALVNLGMTYRKAGNNKKAREALESALQKSEKGSRDYTRAQRLLSLLETDLKVEAMSSDDRASLEQPAMTVEEGPEDRLLARIGEMQESEYDKYLEREDSQRDNVLSILRGWSSAVTLLEGSKGLWRGGGYFIKWGGKGIVIDPGFDFLRNFHDAKYHGREIDAVLVTHNHTDHNADVRAIDDLRYELYKRLIKDP